MAITYRKVGTRYAVYADGALVGHVEKFASRHLTEWTAYDINGTKVGSVGTRMGAASLLTR